MDIVSYADEAGQYYARHYDFPPMVGRVIGYLSVCEPAAQTIAALSETLLASRSAIDGAVKALEDMGVVRRSRAAGERMDRVKLDASASLERGFDATEYKELGDLARKGLTLLTAAQPERRAFLLEAAALADFLSARIPALHQEWTTHRDALRTSGNLKT